MTPVMYSHLISLSFTGEGVRAAVDMFRGSSADLIASQPGFAGLMAMVDPEAGRSYAFTFWNTERDVAAAATNDQFARDLARYADLMTGPFSRDMYAVLAHASSLRVGDDPFTPATARVTIVPVHPRGWDAAYSALRQLVGWDGSAEGSARGLTLLENRNLSRAIVVEVWDSDEALDEADRRAARFDFEARAGTWLNGRPSREVHQVAARV